MRLQVARECFEAFAAGDRATVERHFAPDYTFSSPADPALDRDGWFARCWPGAGSITAFTFPRLVEIGDDEVLVTYEGTRADGTRFRNTELLRFDAADRVVRTEVYFGWEL